MPKDNDSFSSQGRNRISDFHRIWKLVPHLIKSLTSDINSVLIGLMKVQSDIKCNVVCSRVFRTAE